MDSKEFKKLYSGADTRIMQLAEEARLPGKNRVEEIKNFAKLAGIKRIGIASCIGLQKEADKLKQSLDGEFKEYTANCKMGKIPSAVVLGKDSRGLSCIPAGQVAHLHQNNTELNISFGLCMGHDIIFNQKSKAPVTKLIVKDREHKHNPHKEFESKQ